MTTPNRNLHSLLFFGSLFLLGCQAQDPQNCQLLDARENQAAIRNCKKGNITTKEEYYGADFLQSIESLGEDALRKEINRLIKKDHVTLSYTPCTWVALEDIDESKEDTTTITGFYSGEPRDKNKCASGSRSTLPDHWNREHVFPSSRFKKGAPAYTDLHHLVASDKEVNSARGNLDFNVVETITKATDDCTDCKRSSNYWEPGGNTKGQVARMMFYMDLRYEPGSEFDLSLDTNTGNSGSFSLGNKTALLKWHCAHKVTDEERNRNNKVQNWQGNRNPFIDYPYLVEKIYGDIGECSGSGGSDEDSEESQESTIVTEDSDEESTIVTKDSEESTTVTKDSEKSTSDTEETEESDITNTKEVRIISALVNPSGGDSTKETVTIKNVGVTSVNLKGWTIAGHNGRTSPVLLDQDEFVLGPGDEYVIVELGKSDGAQLRNRGNSKIILYDDATNIVNEVTYTTKPSSGEKVRFSGDEL